MAAEAGIEFRMDRALRANTLLAHRLLWLAEQPCPIPQVDLEERLLQAYFIDGLDIGDPDVLADCAAEVGFDRDEVLDFLDGDSGTAEVAEMLRQAHEAGITAVPTYVIDRQWAIPGAQDPEVFVQVLRRFAANGALSVPSTRSRRSATATPSPPARRRRRRVNADRIILVHGFTQTASSWRPTVAETEREPRSRRRRGGTRRPWPRHPPPTCAPTCPPVPRCWPPRGGRGTYVGYSMGGRLCLHLALASPQLVDRLVLIGTTPGIEDDANVARRRAADDELADEIERVGVAAFVDRWLSQPLFAGLDRSDADIQARLTNSAAGLASSLRLAGTGTQTPLWDAAR